MVDMRLYYKQNRFALLLVFFFHVAATAITYYGEAFVIIAAYNTKDNYYLFNKKSTRSDKNIFPLQAKQENNEIMKIRGLQVQPPRPNDCTYWVTNNLIAGEYPGAKTGNDEDTRLKLRQYLETGITCFIDLTQAGEKADYYNLLMEEATVMGKSDIIQYNRLPIRDFGIPTTGRMKEILDTIDTAIEQENHKVYVHCRGGIGRTGTTVGCYLARHGNTGEEALKEVNRLFQNSDRSYESYNSPETMDQMEFVRNWNDNQN